MHSIKANMDPNREHQSEMALPGSSESGKLNFDSAVIMGSVTYKNTLQLLAGPQVKVFADQELTSNSIIEMVKKEKKNCVGRTLWILTTGIFSICDYGDHPECKLNKCGQSLVNLQMNSELSEIEMAQEIQDILFHIKKICKAIQSELDSSGNVLIVPPIPAVVVQEAAFSSHNAVHEICEKYNAACVDDTGLLHLHIFYNILCDAWSSVASDLLTLGNKTLFSDYQTDHTGKNLVSIKDNNSYQHVLNDWLTMMKILTQLAFVNVECNEPAIDCSPGLGALLTDIAHSEESIKKNSSSSVDNFKCNDERDCSLYQFNHCVVVGCSNFFSELKIFLKDIAVSFFEISIDLGKEALEFLKKEQDNFPKKTMWVFVRGVSDIAHLTEKSSECLYESCENPYCAFVLKNKSNGHVDFRGLSVNAMIEKVIREAENFIGNSVGYVSEGSRVFLAPVVPVSAYNGSRHASFSHAQLHELADSDPRTPILSGSGKEWKATVQQFDQEWMEMILKQVDQQSAEFDILRNQLKQLCHLLNFCSMKEENKIISSAEETWSNGLKAFIGIMLNKKEEIKQVQISSSPVTQLVSKPETDERSPSADGLSKKQNSHIQKNATWTSNAIPSKQPIHKEITECLLVLDNVLDACGTVDDIAYSSAENKETDERSPSADGLSKKQNSHIQKNATLTSNAIPSKQSIQTKITECWLYVDNVSLHIEHNHIQEVLDACGTVDNIAYPSAENKGQIKALYNNESSTLRALQVLNFLKVFGENSTARAPGLSLASASTTEVQPMDQYVIPIIQEVMVKMFLTNLEPSQESTEPQPSQDSKVIDTQKLSFADTQTVSTPTKVENDETQPVPAPTKCAKEKSLKKGEDANNKSQAACLMLVSDVNPDIEQEHIQKILEACGTIRSIIYQSATYKGPLRVLYSNGKSAKRAIRVLRFFKVLGKNSKAYLDGSEDEETSPSEMQPEDRMVIPIIQEVIIEMQKAKAVSRPTQVSIVAKTQTVSKAADSVKEDTAKKKDDPDDKTNAIKENKDDRTKAKEENKNSEVLLINICVSNLSDLVPNDMIKQFVRALGTISESNVENHKFNCEIRGVSNAIQMVMLLNGYRLPDKKLKVSPMEALDFRSAHITSDEEVKVKISQIYKDYFRTIVDALKEPYENEIKFYTYKTQLCKSTKCRNPKSCHNFHSSKDRRRNPINTEYSSSLCEAVKCDEKEACCLSHTKIEQIFHPTVYKNVLCESSVDTGLCNSNDCTKAHPETPDMFFLDSWEDLYVEGLGDTFVFMNGVITNLFKLGNITDLLVLVLTSSDEMVYLLYKTFTSIGKCNNQTVVDVSPNGCVLREGTIMISTPSGLTKLLISRPHCYDFTTVKAMIIDDGLKTLTMAVREKNEKLSAILAKPCANKLVVDDSITTGKVELAVNVLKTTFKELPLGRLKKRWEPLVKKAAGGYEKEELEALAALLKKVENKPPPEEKSEPTFKVPHTPPVPLSRNSSHKPFRRPVSSLEGDITNRNSMTTTSSKSKVTNTMGEQEPDGNKRNNALQQLVSNYQDFHKAGEKEDLSNHPNYVSGFSQVSDTVGGSKTSKPKEPSKLSPPDNVGKKLPYYSIHEMKKKFATIPFKYEEKASISTADPNSLKTDNSSVQSKNDASSSSKKDKSSRSFNSWSKWKSDKSHQSSTEKRRSSSPTSKPEYEEPKESDIDSMNTEQDLKDAIAKETSYYIAHPEKHPKYESEYRCFFNRTGFRYKCKMAENRVWKKVWRSSLHEIQYERLQGKLDKLRSSQKQDLSKFDRKDTKVPSKRKFSESFRDKGTDRKSSRQNRRWCERLDRLRSSQKHDSNKFDRNYSKVISKRKFSESFREKESDRKSSRQNRLGFDSKDSVDGKERKYRSEQYSSKGRDNKSNSISHALSTIRQVCPMLGVLSPALKYVIERIDKAGTESNQCLNILLNDDNAMLIEMACRRFEMLLTTSEGSDRIKLTEALKQIKKLQNESTELSKETRASTSSALSENRSSVASSSACHENSPDLSMRDVGTDFLRAPANRVSTEKLLSDQIRSEEDGAEKSVQCLDVQEIAKATFEKGAEATIQFIKNVFANREISSANNKDINDFYVKVSKIHFQMTLKRSQEQRLPELGPPLESSLSFHSLQTKHCTSSSDTSPFLQNQYSAFDRKDQQFLSDKDDLELFISLRNKYAKRDDGLLPSDFMDTLNQQFPSNRDDSDSPRNDSGLLPSDFMDRVNKHLPSSRDDSNLSKYDKNKLISSDFIQGFNQPCPLDRDDHNEEDDMLPSELTDVGEDFDIPSFSGDMSNTSNHHNEDQWE